MINSIALFSSLHRPFITYSFGAYTIGFHFIITESPRGDSLWAHYPLVGSEYSHNNRSPDNTYRFIYHIPSIRLRRSRSQKHQHLFVQCSIPMSKADFWSEVPSPMGCQLRPEVWLEIEVLCRLWSAVVHIFQLVVPARQRAHLLQHLHPMYVGFKYNLTKARGCLPMCMTIMCTSLSNRIYECNAFDVLQYHQQ